MNAMEVHRFNALRDNYGFAIRCAETGETAIVDAPSVADVVRAFKSEIPTWRAPSTILVTHWHDDHAGGCDGLRDAFGSASEIKVIAPKREMGKISARVDRWVSDGDVVSVGDLRATVLETPGHTLGHAIYHFADDGHVFVGDTLFALGCGRLFEGTPEQMWSSVSKILAMSDETKVWCAHEYTQANAKFALSVDPENAALVARAKEIAAQRERGEPTIPTTVGDERRTNPFCRPDSEDVQRGVNMLRGANLASVFGAIRAAKDKF